MVGQATNALKHGMSRTPFYHAWLSMKARCKGNHKDYGGRGISVCDRWSSFENFKSDMFYSWKPGLTLDRRDNDGNYEPSNCRWATRTVQNLNKRNSLPRNILQQLEDNGLTRDHYRHRISAGWTEEQARSIPIGAKR